MFSEKFMRNILIVVLSLSISFICEAGDRREELFKRANSGDAEAQNELSHAEEFDYWVINDKFEDAANDLQTIIAAQRQKQANATENADAERLIQRQQKQKYSQLFENLLAKSE